jgi:hypothetical protein
MRRRQVLLATTAIATGFAGCNSSRSGIETGTHANQTTASTTTSETSHTPETPPEEFAQEWSFDRDDDWTERRRATDYPNSDEAVDWTPNYARSAGYVHVPSGEELASTIDTSDAPAVGCAVLSKWALPSEFSGTPVDLVAEVRGWYKMQFDWCPIRDVSPQDVEPFQNELESGRIIGSDNYDAEGDTGRLKSTFQATVDDELIDVERVTYEAEAHLYGLLGPEKRVGYLAGGGWPVTDTVTLHTAENGEVDVTASVNGESWKIEDGLIEVLNDIDQS